MSSPTINVNQAGSDTSLLAIIIWFVHWLMIPRLARLQPRVKVK